jgi:hypothetical protein
MGTACQRICQRTNLPKITLIKGRSLLGKESIKLSLRSKETWKDNQRFTCQRSITSKALQGICQRFVIGKFTGILVDNEFSYSNPVIV